MHTAIFVISYRGATLSANTRTKSTPRSFYIALDGPSALSLYRDREDCARREQDSEASASQEPPVPTEDYSQEVGAVRNKAVAADLVDSDEVYYYLSDEDIAAELADTSIFGHHGPRRLTTRQGNSEADIPSLRRSSIRTFARCATNSRDLKRIPYAQIGLQPPMAGSPLCIVAPDTSSRRTVRNVRQRACAHAVPTNSLYRLGDNVLVPTPELTFLLLARHLELVRLTMAGLELCGHYRMVGATTSHPVTSKRTIYNCDALTTPEALQKFLERAGDFPGIASAKRACTYLVKDSASPMETIVYLLLCLPRNMGGYGLPRPTLNAKRTVNTYAQSFTFAHTLVPDLYWASAHLDVEYDSDEFHADPLSLAKGARRTLALRAMHVDVISMTSDMLHDEAAFGASVRLVAKKLGYRLPAPRKNEQEKRHKLRDLLLG